MRHRLEWEDTAVCWLNLQHRNQPHIKYCMATQTSSLKKQDSKYNCNLNSNCEHQCGFKKCTSFMECAKVVQKWKKKETAKYLEIGKTAHVVWSTCRRAGHCCGTVVLEKDWSTKYSIAISYTTIQFESILLGWDGIDCWYWCPFVCCDMHRSPFTICLANWNALMEDSGFEGTVDQSDKPS